MSNHSNPPANTNDQVIDFSEIRAQKLEEKRRKTERIFFKQLLGVYCVTGDDRVRPIEMIDVSEEGVAFQVPFENKSLQPNLGDEVPLRLYFSQDTYLPIVAKVQNARACIEQGARYMRFGCTVDTQMQSYDAFLSFVRFLILYAEHSHRDKGDVTVFYL